MFTEITMKNVATYNSEGVTINALNPLNYFFGNNGCGKSTITRYLHSLAAGTDKVKYSDCDFKGYDSQKEEILVFNQDFIDTHFKNSDSLNGVFTLNKTNNDIDEEIKKNESIITEKKEKRKNFEQINKDLLNEKKDLRERLKKEIFIKRDIFKTFAKIKLDFSNNKEKYLNKIQELVNTSQLSKCALKDLSNLYKKLYEEELIYISANLDQQMLKDITNVNNELSILLNEIIVGKDDVQLSKLIKKLDNKAWIYSGKEYLKQTNGKCPFCQKKTIDAAFLEELDLIFDEESKKKIKRIEELKNKYEILQNSLVANIKNIQTIYNEKNIVTNLLMAVQELFSINLIAINSKLENPNERKKQKDYSKVFTMYEQITKQIAENNSLFNSLEINKEKLKKHMWDYLAFESQVLLKKYIEDDKKITNEISINETEIEKIITEIKMISQENVDLRKKTVNTRQAVDNINQMLCNSGFTGFKIEEKVKVNNISQYYLKRTIQDENQNVFNTLSEGEKNFISFLYFYQICLGATKIQADKMKKKIIVIDDPITSMDSQVLFIVSTLVNRLITYKGQKSKTDRQKFLNDNIIQVLIFTHNYYFYKEVALDKRPICTLKSHYLVSKNGDNQTLISKREYKEQDDYSLMWEAVRNTKENLSETDTSNNILISNTFRRILESYAVFIGLGKDSWATVLNDSDKDSPNHYLKCAFVSMINNESHKVSPFDSMYYSRINNESPTRLFTVFEEIFNVIGKDHYVMMMNK